MTDEKMFFIDPHIHMSARTTDDYIKMAKAGIVAVIEPAFWIGQPRTNAGSFIDYFSSLVNWEPFRASQFGVRHFCAIGLNAKEANNESLSQEVIELIPRFAGKDNVVAIGEIGFDEITKAEETALVAQIGIAKDLNMLILIHTPHRDKKTGTLRTMDILEECRIPPEKVVIDHNNEETVRSVLDRGYWAAFTIYPFTKMSNERMVSIVQQYGAERILVDSSADWGVSDPLAVPKTAALMLKKGIPREAVIKTCYQNALMAYAPSGVIHEAELLRPKAVDWDQRYEGNSVLRGQKPQDINDLIIQ